MKNIWQYKCSLWKLRINSKCFQKCYLSNKSHSRKRTSKYVSVASFGLSSCGPLARVTKVSDCKAFDRTEFKILTPKEMLHDLPIALAQVKAGNTSENLLD